MQIKTLLKAGIAVGILKSSALFGATFTFSPSPSDLGDLDHHTAVTWGITWGSIPAGQTIQSATLKINNIYDWQVESNSLFIHLLNNPTSGVHSITDNSNDNVISDYFGGQGLLIATYIDSDGPNSSTNLVYNLNQSQINTLTTYITDSNQWWQGDFGFGFDPDCHYYNSGVTFEIVTGPSNTPGVPDNGSTIALLGLGMIGLVTLRRRLAA